MQPVFYSCTLQSGVCDVLTGYGYCEVVACACAVGCGALADPRCDLLCCYPPIVLLCFAPPGRGVLAVPRLAGSVVYGQT